jgi:quercetin dioxygenase-like cupin family protein
MKILSAISTGCLLGLLVLGSAYASEEEVFPKVVHQTSAEVSNVPGEFELKTLVLEFPPGAWTPLHMHGADGLVTVLAGEMTLDVTGQEPRTYGVGDHWRERVGVPHRAGNENQDLARITVTFVIPPGVPTTIPLEE